MKRTLKRERLQTKQCSLSWDIEELKKLSSEGRSLRVELSAAFDVASNADIAMVYTVQAVHMACDHEAQN